MVLSFELRCALLICNLGESGLILQRSPYFTQTKDLPPLYLYLRLLCTRPGSTSVVKRCQVASCAVFANSAGILQVRPQPPYSAVSLPMSKELVLIMRVAEHTAHHANPDDSFVCSACFLMIILTIDRRSSVSNLQFSIVLHSIVLK